MAQSEEEGPERDMVEPKRASETERELLLVQYRRGRKGDLSDTHE